MDEALRRTMEQADRERRLMQQADDPWDSIARQMEKLQLLDAVSRTSTVMSAINEKLKLSEALGGSSAAAMEKAGLLRDFADSKLLNERVMAAFGPALGNSAFEKAIQAMSRPLVDEETLRKLELAHSSFQSAYKLPNLTEFQRILERLMPSGVAQQLDAYTLKFKESLGGISAAIADKAALANSFGRSLSSLSEYGDLFNGMGAIADALASVDWEAIGEGEKALDEAGYSFTKERWALSFFVELADAPPTAREQVADEALLNYTRDPEFTSELTSYLNGAAILKRRSPVVERAIRAHPGSGLLRIYPSAAHAG